ncbi:hypothetical protein V1477_011228, partial [Vespula maculifrons]
MSSQMGQVFTSTAQRYTVECHFRVVSRHTTNRNEEDRGSCSIPIERREDSVPGKAVLSDLVKNEWAEHFLSRPAIDLASLRYKRLNTVLERAVQSLDRGDRIENKYLLALDETPSVSSKHTRFEFHDPEEGTVLQVGWQSQIPDTRSQCTHPIAARATLAAATAGAAVAAATAAATAAAAAAAAAAAVVAAAWPPRIHKVVPVEWERTVASNWSGFIGALSVSKSISFVPRTSMPLGKLVFTLRPECVGCYSVLRSRVGT